MTYEEFRIGVLKANQKKHHFKVNNSYGTKDAYRWSIKNKLIDKAMTEKDFRKIINVLNQSLQDRLMKGLDAKFPEGMGGIGVRKFNAFVSLEGDKIKTNMAVDWASTLKLWYEDKEAFCNKTLVRCDTKEKFKFVYAMKKANYKNKIYYEFTPTRSLKLKLKEIINKQGFDALSLNYKDGLPKC
jgi:hypothetical protein